MGESYCRAAAREAQVWLKQGAGEAQQQGGQMLEMPLGCSQQLQDFSFSSRELQQERMLVLTGG